MAKSKSKSKSISKKSFNSKKYNKKKLSRNNFLKQKESNKYLKYFPQDYNYFTNILPNRLKEYYYDNLKNQEYSENTVSSVEFSKMIIKVNYLGFFTDDSQEGLFLEASKEDLVEPSRYDEFLKINANPVTKDIWKQREYVGGYIRKEYFEKLYAQNGKDGIFIIFESKNLVPVSAAFITFSDGKTYVKENTWTSSNYDNKEAFYDTFIDKTLNPSDFTNFDIVDSVWSRKGMIKKLIHYLENILK